VTGTSLHDLIAGDNNANRLDGGDGDDSIIGNGGADVLIGGAGDDEIEVFDLNFNYVDGSDGVDTLKIFTGNNAIDLGEFYNVTGIERIDLTGHSEAANSLTLSWEDVCDGFGGKLV